MFLMFFGHVLTLDQIKEQKNDMTELVELAKQHQDHEKEFQYAKALNGYENVLKQEDGQILSLSEATHIGIFAGFIFSGMVYGVYHITERISKETHPYIWNPKILLTSCITVILHFFIYELFVSFTHPHLATSVIDLAVAFYLSIPIPIIISLHLVLQKRIKVFETRPVVTPGESNEKIKEKGDNYRHSIELEHKTWTQLLQSSVFGILFIVGGILLSFMTNIQDLKDLSSMDGGIKAIVFQIFLIALWFFVGFFGILLRILRYLGDLSELLLVK
jgi:hypothetical protein